MIFIVIGIIILAGGYTQMKKRRLIIDTPTSPINDLSEGLREVKGKVEPLQVLISPLSGKSCVYYSITVSERRKSHSHGHHSHHHWVTVHSDVKMNNFLVQDDTGVALIRPEGAELKILPDRGFNSSSMESPSPEMSAYLQSVNIKSVSFFGLNKTMRLAESYLEPGDEVYVLGEARPLTEGSYNRLPEGGGGQRSSYIFKSGPSQKLLVSDKSEEKILSETTSQTKRLLILGAGMSLFGLIALITKLAH